jgi:hypothetical protein
MTWKRSALSLLRQPRRPALEQRRVNEGGIAIADGRPGTRPGYCQRRRLARDVPAADQTRVEGAVDAAVWGAAAAASLASTAILAAGGYAVLAGAAGVLAVLPVTVLLGRRRPGTPSRPEGTQSASRPDCPVLSPAEEDFPVAGPMPVGWYLTSVGVMDTGEPADETF